MRPAQRWIVVLALAALSTLLWRGRAAVLQVRSPPSQAPALSWNAPLPALPARPLTDGLPRPAVAVAAVTRASRTDLWAIEALHRERLSEPEFVDEESMSLRGSVLAYRVLVGWDPTQNYVGAHDLAEARSWRIQPDEGGVILGFTLDAEGTRLAYLEVDSRPSGIHPPWRVVTVDLASGARQAILDETQREGSLLPVDWQGDTMLFREMVPFASRYHGLWLSESDGGDLRFVLPESGFVGTPRLSPGGDRLAVLRPDPQTLPATLGPVEPHATTLWLVDLGSGEEVQIGATDAAHDFADLVWDADGLVTLLGEWDDDRQVFVHRELLRLHAEPSSSAEVIHTLQSGEIARLIGCPRHGWMAVVRTGESTSLLQGRPTVTVATFPHEILDWGACPTHRARAEVAAPAPHGHSR